MTWIPWAAAVAVAVEVVLAFLLPNLTPGRDPVHDYVSDATVDGSRFSAWYPVLAVPVAGLHAPLTVALMRRGRNWAAKASAAGLLMFVGALAIGLFFSCDPGCRLESTEAIIHYAFSVTGFVGTGLSALVVVATWVPAEQRTRALAIAMLFIDVMILISDVVDRWRGLWEGLMFLSMMAWTFVLWQDAKLFPDQAAT